ncbi:hypothetical protein D5086_015625 [Populus alba]|uniref:Uncharacterized protein n=1 Tax=Populus alba TaxID=43335 RepID=A0ACC4BRP6_POPAL
MFFNTSKELIQGFFQLDNTLTKKSLPTRQNLRSKSLFWFGSSCLNVKKQRSIVKARKGQEVGELFGGKEGFYEEERSNARRR